MIRGIKLGSDELQRHACKGVNRRDGRTHYNANVGDYIIFPVLVTTCFSESEIFNISRKSVSRLKFVSLRLREDN